MGSNSKEILVTPEIALKTLEKNTANRRLRKRNVEFLSEQMASGAWRSDLAPCIILGRGGVVIDGQHRLSAIVASGVSITCEVKYIDEDSALGLPIDIGANRNASDILLMEPRVSQVISAAAAIVRGRSGKASTDELLRWDAVLGSVAKEMNEKHGGLTRYTSSAGVRLGFCLSALGAIGAFTKDEAIREYGLLKGAYLEDLSYDSMRSLYRRLMTGPGDTRGGGRTLVDAYLTCTAIDNPNLSRIQSKPAPKMSEHMKSIMLKAESLAGVPWART